MKTGEEAVGILLDALNRLNVDYMVVGSFSSNRYGVPRATQDADILVSLLAADRDRLFAALPKEFQIDPQVGFEMITGTWRQLVRLPTIPFTIELFELSSDPYDQVRFERRRKLTLLSRDAWLPSAEDVIVQKLRWCKNANRGKDFDDVVSVLGVQGAKVLDWSYLEKWCRIHGSWDLLQEAKLIAADVWEEGGSSGSS